MSVAFYAKLSLYYTDPPACQAGKEEILLNYFPAVCEKLWQILINDEEKDEKLGGGSKNIAGVFQSLKLYCLVVPET